MTSTSNGPSRPFQRRHGLEPDGVVGAATASALERARARAPETGPGQPRALALDHPGPRREVHPRQRRRFPARRSYESGREVLSMAAVVGTAYRQTPDFSGKMSYFEINPTWTVPPKLAREDILPKVRERPRPTSGKGLPRVPRTGAGARPEIDGEAVDWSAVDGGAPVLSSSARTPARRTPLGRIKFMFPNKFDVYLHDTPERWLFGRAARDLELGLHPASNGPSIWRLTSCGDDPAWTMERIARNDRGTGATRVVVLREPLNVHILYWTAWLDEDGRVQFRQRHLPQGRGPRPGVAEKASASAEVGPVTRSGRGRRRRGRSPSAA
ncbi:MAG: L,D-transpeptidase family protein [Sphingobacterium sp.]|nr:L,D-transpeptidase family protein [Sphingobacterium sp.]